jgi:catechol-2,3-dioxygenase
MTPQERECINELLEAATVNGVSIEAAARSIGEVMLNLNAAEIAEMCRLYAEELGLNAAAYPATGAVLEARRGDNQRNRKAGFRQRALAVAID